MEDVLGFDKITNCGEFSRSCYLASRLGKQNGKEELMAIFSFAFDLLSRMLTIMLLVIVVVDAAAFVSRPVWQHKTVACGTETLVDVHSGRDVLRELEFHVAMPHKRFCIGLSKFVSCVGKEWNVC